VRGCLQTGTCIQRLEGHTGAVTSLNYLPLSTWSYSSGAVGKSASSSMAGDDDDDELLSGGGGGGGGSGGILGGKGAARHALSWFDDASTGVVLSTSEDGSIRIWQLEDSKTKQNYRGTVFVLEPPTSAAEQQQQQQAPQSATSLASLFSSSFSTSSPSLLTTAAATSGSSAPGARRRSHIEPTTVSPTLSPANSPCSSFDDFSSIVPMTMRANEPKPLPAGDWQPLIDHTFLLPELFPPAPLPPSSGRPPPPNDAAPQSPVREGAPPTSPRSASSSSSSNYWQSVQAPTVEPPSAEEIGIAGARRLTMLVPATGLTEMLLQHETERKVASVDGTADSNNTKLADTDNDSELSIATNIIHFSKSPPSSPPPAIPTFGALSSDNTSSSVDTGGTEHAERQPTTTT